MSVEHSPRAWAAYWDGMRHRHIFTVEAGDHLRRLLLSVPIRSTDRVLDFGCGFGHVVVLLAPIAGHVSYWDAAASMREATAARTAVLANVEPVDLAGPMPPEGVEGFDLIVVNSVVQYMGREELGDWLDRWRLLLAPDGRIVLSDIPTPGGSAVGELAGMLRFAARHRFLLRALRDGFDEARRYGRSRGTTDIQRWTAAELTTLAAERDQVIKVLPINLTHRSGRLSVVLTAR